MAADRSKTYQRAIVLMLSVNFGIVFFDRSAINYLMPFIKPDLNLTNFEVGALSSALSLSWALAGLFVGGLSDRLQKRKTLLIACNVIFSCASLLSGFAAGFASLIAARLLMGIAEGGIMPLSQALIAADVDPQRRGLAMGITQNLGSNVIAHLIGPIVLVAVGSALGWRHALLLAAAPGLVMAILLQIFVREPASPSPNVDEGRATVRIGDVLRQRNIVLCIAITCLLLGLFAIYASFMPLLLVALPGVDPRHMSWILAAVGFSAAVSAVLVTGASDAFGRRPVAIVGSLLGLFLPLSVLFGTGPWQIMILVAIGGSCSAVLAITMSAIPSETVPPHVLASAIGLTMGVGEIVGGVVVPLVAGGVADRYGLHALLWVMVAFCLLAACMAALLRETAPPRAAAGRAGI